MCVCLYGCKCMYLRAIKHRRRSINHGQEFLLSFPSVWGLGIELRSSALAAISFNLNNHGDPLSYVLLAKEKQSQLVGVESMRRTSSVWHFRCMRDSERKCSWFSGLPGLSYWDWHREGKQTTDSDVNVLRRGDVFLGHFYLGFQQPRLTAILFFVLHLCELTRGCFLKFYRIPMFLQEFVGMSKGQRNFVG